MNPQRVQRLNEEIKREISDVIQRHMKDPRIGFVSVTDVELSRDLQHVKIFVSVYGDENARSQTMQALESGKGFIRGELGKRVRLRHTPEVDFRFDESLERGARIFKLLDEVKSGGSTHGEQ